MKHEAPAVYVLVDHRRDGRPRIVGEFVDPLAASAAAELLRRYGSDCRVELITEVLETRGDAATQ